MLRKALPTIKVSYNLGIGKEKMEKKRTSLQNARK